MRHLSFNVLLFSVLLLWADTAVFAQKKEQEQAANIAYRYDISTEKLSAGNQQNKCLARQVAQTLRPEELRKEIRVLTSAAKAPCARGGSMPARGEKMRVRFFDDKTVALDFESVAPVALNGRQGMTASVRVENGELLSATVVEFDGKIRVEIDDYENNRVYRLAYDEHLQHYTAAEIDKTKIPAVCGVCCGEHAETSHIAHIPHIAKTDEQAHAAPRIVSRANAETYVLEYMVVYDITGANYAKANGGLEAFALAAVQNMNNIYQNTNIDARYHLAATLEYKWASPSIADGMNKLISDETITRARFLAKADQIAMFSQPSSTWGATGLAISEPKRPEDAVSSIVASAAAANYVAAHEAAHNMGCQHSREQIGAPGNHPYAVGANNAPYCTVMSYGTEDAGVRVPIFSSPNSKWQNVQLGSATQDNARKIREYLPTVVNFGEQLKDRTFKPAFTEWRATSAAQKKNLFVGNDTYLTASSNAAWLAVSPATVSFKDANLELAVEENKGVAERTGTITIGGFYPEVKVTVIQAAAGTAVHTAAQADTPPEAWTSGSTLIVKTDAETRLEVYSSVGKSVLSRHLENGTARIETLVPGFYIVKLIKKNRNNAAAVKVRIK